MNRGLKEWKRKQQPVIPERGKKPILVHPTAICRHASGLSGQGQGFAVSLRVATPQTCWGAPVYEFKSNISFGFDRSFLKRAKAQAESSELPR